MVPVSVAQQQTMWYRGENLNLGSKCPRWLSWDELQGNGTSSLPSERLIVEVYIPHFAAYARGGCWETANKILKLIEGLNYHGPEAGNFWWQICHIITHIGYLPGEGTSPWVPK